MMNPVSTRIMLLAAGMSIVSCGSPGADRDPNEVTSSASLPPGYALRLDRQNRERANFVVTPDDDGLQVGTGPAGILYRLDQTVDTGGYTVGARFTEIGAPVGHREGFGLFIGGQELAGDSPRYTYFLVRGDGRYLMKRRDGPTTEELSSGWQSSSAVRVPTDEERDVTNELAVSVDDGRLRFLCNGEPVADVPTDALSVQGVVGVRVNHNLRVRIQGFRIDLQDGP